MKYPWLTDYCLEKKGAEQEYKIEWEATLFKAGGKMFALLGGDKEKKPILSLKCEPHFSEMLRRQYSDIIPGYYLNKEHWNSVHLNGEVPGNVLKQMIDISYRLVFEGLSKKIQAQIEQIKP